MESVFYIQISAILEGFILYYIQHKQINKRKANSLQIKKKRTLYCDSN